MNPCKDCIKQYGDPLCTNLGHCVFEGTNEKPAQEHTYNASICLTKTSLPTRDGAKSNFDSS